MIGTNLSVWFSVLIQETKHEILTFYDPENRTLKISHRLGELLYICKKYWARGGYPVFEPKIGKIHVF